MGSSNSQSDYCHPNWNLISSHLYQNKLNGQLIEHQEVSLTQIPSLNQYEHRLNLMHPNIVKLIYFRIQKNRCQLCENRNKKVDIFIQGKIQRKNDYLKSACHCKEIVNGLKFLKKQYGPFKVSINNIWVKDEKVKVWICQDPFVNEIKSTSQVQMVQNIKSILSQFQCSHNFKGIPQRFFSTFQTTLRSANSFQSISNSKNRIFKSQSITQSNKIYQNSHESLLKSNSFQKQQKGSHYSSECPSRNINFSYSSSSNSKRNIPTLSYVHLSGGFKKVEHFNEIPKLKDFNEMTKTKNGVQSDRTQDISMRKSNDNFVNKTMQKSQKREVIDEILIESERMMSSGKQNVDEIVKTKRQKTNKQQMEVMQKVYKTPEYIMPESTKIVIKKYLTEDEYSNSKSVSNQMDLITKQKQWSQNEERYISGRQDQARQTKSVYQEEKLGDDPIMENRSGLVQIQMFQDHKKTLKEQMDLLFKLYQPQQNEEKHIKRKAQEKKASFADLKAEAGKLLGNGFF